MAIEIVDLPIKNSDFPFIEDTIKYTVMAQNTSYKYYKKTPFIEGIIP